jgi:replication factor C small subunit
MSFTGGRKYVILDEADGLAPMVQPALRGFMEEFSHNAGFIFTVNNSAKMIPAIHSRCKVIDFRIKKGDMVSLASGFMKRLEGILKTEGIGYDKKAIAGLIQNHFPDWRRILNEVQYHGASGKIDAGILANAEGGQIDALIEHMKRKEFSKVRVWVAENADVPCQTLFKSLYDRASTLFSPNSIPEVVIILNKYGYQAAFVADVEINTAACFAELMLVVEWKN